MTDRQMRTKLLRLCEELDQAARADGLPPLRRGSARRLLFGASLALSLAACGETPIQLPYGVAWDYGPADRGHAGDARIGDAGIDRRRRDAAPDQVGLDRRGDVRLARDTAPEKK